MTTTSAISGVIAYLVQAATVAFPRPAQVIEGPLIVDSQLTPASRIWIGYDPTSDTTPAAEAVQDFAALNGARSRNEDGSVVCCVESWTGNADNAAATARLGAFALLSSFELLLRGVPLSGGPGDATMGGAVKWSQVAGPISFDYDSDDNGVIGRIVFHVTYRQRLTTG